MSKRSSQQQTDPDQKNRPEQLNRNNDAFWQSRGYDERPSDWQTRPESEEKPK